MTKFALMAVVTAFVAGSVGAQPPVVVIADEPPLPRESVSFADLNLGMAAGQERLVWRIKGAASRVCDDAGKTGIESLAYRSCFQVAVKGGLRQMEQLLSARESGSTLATAALTISGN